MRYPAWGGRSMGGGGLWHTNPQEVPLALNPVRLETKRNPRWGSTVDDVLEEEGVLEEFRAIAIKEVIAWQSGQAMKKKLSKNRTAELMETSRAKLDRLLAPTLETLQRAAHVLGRELRIELV